MFRGSYVRLVPPWLASRPPPTPSTLASLLQLASPPLQPLPTLPTRLVSPQQWLAPPPRFTSPQPLPPHSSQPIMQHLFQPLASSPPLRALGAATSIASLFFGDTAFAHAVVGRVAPVSGFALVLGVLSLLGCSAATCVLRRALARYRARSFTRHPPCAYRVPVNAGPTAQLGAWGGVTRTCTRPRLSVTRTCTRPRLSHGCHHAHTHAAMLQRTSQPPAVTLPRWLRAWGGVECRRLVF